MDFDYFYNREAERFNFLKVPEILVDGEEFRGLSAEASLIIAKNFVKDYEKMKKENIGLLTALGVDYISSGALTHSAPILDISMKNLHAVE